MTTEPSVVPLGTCDSSAVVGGKSASLTHLIRAGISVPAGAVITTAAHRDWLRQRSGTVHESVVKAVVASLGAVSETVLAVRSSAAEEDGSRASFAGQYRTLLNVRPAGLGSAIAEVFASAAAPSVVRYARIRGIDKVAEMAVLVQTQVEPTLAGACFTVDPVSGRPEFVVEGVRGLAEGLMAGSDVPEFMVRVDKAAPGAAAAGATDPAVADLILRLLPVVRVVEQVLGAPQDIEWAFDGRMLWILQSRPITTVAG